MGAGWLSVRYRLKSILFWIYLGRTVTLLWYAPVTT